MDAIGDFLNALISAPFVCIGWIIVGVAAGALARRLTGGPDRAACSDFVLGIVGSFVGNLVIGPFLDMEVGGITQVVISLIIATLGAVILIFIGNLVFGRGR